MAEHIAGSLAYERAGRSGPLLAFIHPNPMDHSSWMYQMAHLSTWFRCIAVDLPGYGTSPAAASGLTVDDLAAACWEVMDEVAPGERAILVGSSVGSVLCQHMHRQRPASTAALVLTGTGYSPGKEFAAKRIKAFEAGGLDYRRAFALEDFSPAFRTSPMAAYFADMLMERNRHADLESIVHQFEALALPDPEDLQSSIACPTLIISGTEDSIHERAFDLQARIPDCELQALAGAGHACHMEQPWAFDGVLLEFLRRHELAPR
jgi:pimeloyl-ACP methyl ester carboxylesterase